ncbi:MAG: hypothetical protein WDZ85_03835 [Candidatus Paceibacterota bacterium]
MKKETVLKMLNLFGNQPEILSLLPEPDRTYELVAWIKSIQVDGDCQTWTIEEYRQAALLLFEPKRSEMLMMILAKSVEEEKLRTVILLAEPERSNQLDVILEKQIDWSDFVNTTSETLTLMVKPSRCVGLVKLFRRCLDEGQFNLAEQAAKLIPEAERLKISEMILEAWMILDRPKSGFEITASMVSVLFAHTCRSGFEAEALEEKILAKQISEGQFNHALKTVELINQLDSTEGPGRVLAEEEWIVILKARLEKGEDVDKVIVMISEPTLPTALMEVLATQIENGNLAKAQTVVSLLGRALTEKEMERIFEVQFNNGLEGVRKTAQILLDLQKPVA